MVEWAQFWAQREFGRKKLGVESLLFSSNDSSKNGRGERATEITEDLQAALDQFTQIASDLKSWGFLAVTEASLAQYARF